jgi:LuxR family maltose regulon positive regulatory protein
LLSAQELGKLWATANRRRVMKTDAKEQRMNNSPIVDASFLLLTKLAPPPARPDCVRRQRLFERLDAGIASRLMLVATPAGFGKTTLLSSWYATHEDLPASEQEPDHALMTLKVSSLASTETFLTSLLNVFSTSRWSSTLGTPDPTILILDDYHVITNQEIHTAVAFLLEHLPPSLHLLIVSRTSPPLPLTKLRASSYLAELGAEDLRFSAEEMTHFLRGTLPLSLTTDEIARLEEQTGL